MNRELFNSVLFLLNVIFAHALVFATLLVLAALYSFGLLSLSFIWGGVASLSAIWILMIIAAGSLVAKLISQGRDQAGDL